MIYDEIYNFCKVKNSGHFLHNTLELPTPRVQFIVDLLEREGIPYDLIMFKTESIEGTAVASKKGKIKKEYFFVGELKVRGKKRK